MMAQMSGLGGAPPAAPAAPDFFHLVINGLADQGMTPISSSAFPFEFNGASQWRLELPASGINLATESMTQPLGLCIYLTQVRLFDRRIAR